MKSRKGIALNLGTPTKGTAFESILLNRNTPNACITGQTGSGKSALLSHILHDMAKHYTREELHISVYDCCAKEQWINQLNEDCIEYYGLCRPKDLGACLKQLGEIHDKKARELQAQGSTSFEQSSVAPRELVIINDLSQVLDNDYHYAETIRGFMQTCGALGINIIITDQSTANIQSLREKCSFDITLQREDKAGSKGHIARVSMERGQDLFYVIPNPQGYNPVVPYPLLEVLRWQGVVESKKPYVLNIDIPLAVRKVNTATSINLSPVQNVANICVNGSAAARDYAYLIVNGVLRMYYAPSQIEVISTIEDNEPAPIFRALTATKMGVQEMFTLLDKRFAKWKEATDQCGLASITNLRREFSAQPGLKMPVTFVITDAQVSIAKCKTYGECGIFFIVITDHEINNDDVITYSLEGDRGNLMLVGYKGLDRCEKFRVPANISMDSKKLLGIEGVIANKWLLESTFDKYFRNSGVFKL